MVVSVVDVVEALTDSPTPRQYWGKVKQKNLDLQLSQFGYNWNWNADGKNMTLIVPTPRAFSYYTVNPSPKAEPLKRWLAKVGYERVQEIENPENLRDHMGDFELILTMSAKPLPRFIAPKIQKACQN